MVLGTGWAGEGHTLAMRAGGAVVSAVCGRRAEAARALAGRLGVPGASDDWRAVLRAERPDVVCLGTPAAVRGEVVAEAVALGCHLFCDKPLALDAGEARRLWDLARAGGVRHAYASTYLYDPSAAWIAELVAGGAIGRLLEIEVSLRSRRGALAPWSWAFDIPQGGGVLNNGFTHILGTLQRITGGLVARAQGDAVIARRLLPVVPGVTDFRQLLTAAVTPEAAASLPWRPVEAEERYRALLALRVGDAELPVTATFNAATPAAWPANGLRLFGAAATIVAEDTGAGAYRVLRRTPDAPGLEPLPVPDRLAAALPDAGDVVQSRWNALARDFLADVRGEPHAPYLTFRDGWRFQAVIDAIRTGQAWAEPPDQAGGVALTV